MDRLSLLVNTELTKSEFVRSLNTSVARDQIISDFRLALYNEARAKHLEEEGGSMPQGRV